ncbi:MAG: hypothetical protein ACK55Z_29015, partial [bacterium]
MHAGCRAFGAPGAPGRTLGIQRVLLRGTACFGLCGGLYAHPALGTQGRHKERGVEVLALGRAVVGAREEGQQGKHGLVRGAAAPDLEQALVAQESVQP